MAGLDLDEWQQAHLTAALGETTAGRWAAFEVAECVPRQNGKNGELEARQLTGLYLLEEVLQIHSAHMADTSVEQLLRVESLIEATPELSRRTKRITHGKGDECIELHRHPRTGRAPRLRFRTRTGGGGRGFSAETVYLDEAMILPETFHGTLMPVLSAMRNPQLWYTGSAVDEEVHEHGRVFTRIRQRGIDGDPSLVYLEYSLDVDHPDHVTDEMATDPECWARANPAFGVRITPGFIASEQRSMSRRAFAVERLGVGAWPDLREGADRVIEPAKWTACREPDSQISGGLCFAVDVTPDRSRASIGVAGIRGDKRMHVEVVENRRGTGWVVERMRELEARQKPVAVVLDAGGSAASLLPDLSDALRMELTLTSAREMAQACGLFFDLVDQEQLCHLGTPELDDAVTAARKRNLAGAWAWAGDGTGVDISPLVVVTLALWGARTLGVTQSKARVINPYEYV